MPSSTPNDQEPAKSKNVSLRDIAEKLGCSRSTVSYALKNQPCISKDVTKKVQALARQMGWKPNAMLAKQFSLIRSSVVDRNLPNLAIVLNKPEKDMTRQSTSARHLSGAQQRAVELGYSVSVFNLAEKPLPSRRLLGVLRARGVEGVVFLATLGQGTTLSKEYLQIGAHFACSVVGVRYPDPCYHVAIVDLLSTGSLVIGELRKEGFRRPGAVIPRGVDRPLSWGFGGGIQSGLFELSEEDRLPVCYVGGDEVHIPEYSFSEITAWINRERPDVLITTDTENMNRYLAQAEAPISRLKVCSLDYSEGNEAQWGVDQRAETAGAAAVDLVIGQIHRNERGVPTIQRTLQIEGAWVKVERVLSRRRAAGSRGSRSSGQK